MKCIVSVSNDKKGAYEQVKGIKIAKTKGLIPSSTHLTASFMYVKTLKILTGKKVKRGVVIYNSWKQQFEDKTGNKK